jgi:hypothetical protein
LRANSHSTSQEIPCLLWNPSVHYHVHKRPQLVPMLSHMNAVHTVPSCFPKLHFNIILVFRVVTSVQVEFVNFKKIPNKERACLCTFLLPAVSVNKGVVINKQLNYFGTIYFKKLAGEARTMLIESVYARARLHMLLLFRVSRRFEHVKLLLYFGVTSCPKCC